MVPRRCSTAFIAPALFVFTFVCSACGGSDGSGGGSSPPADPGGDLSPMTSLSDADKAHFLNRTHFGIRPTELASLNAMGLEAYVDWMLSMPVDATLEATAKSTHITDADYPGGNELMYWWLHLMFHSQNPFQESLALFWHDHFAASQDALVGDNNWWMYAHVELWRKQTTGKLRDLLYKMATDWLMLVWLNGVESTATAPNENFAREFWELFTLGADNGYSQADIVQGARTFTGYRSVFVPNYFGAGRDSRVVQWDFSRHDNGSKTIFGQTLNGNGAAEYQDLVDLTLAARGTQVASYLCRKLWEYWGYRDPGASLVNDLAQGFIASGFDLKLLYKRILMSKEFFSARAKAGLVKTVLHHHVGYLRTTRCFINMQRIDFSLRGCGQEPTRPPSVNGWPKHNAWLSSQGLIERANFLRDCNFYKTDPGQTGYDAGSLIPSGQTGDAQVVDHLCWLLNVRLETAQRDRCILYLNQDRNTTSVVSQPWDFSNATQRDKKIRGLLYILGQHPTYQLR